MYFLFNRTTYLTGALYVHPLWFYKHQHDNRVRSTQNAFSLSFAAILVNCAPSGEMHNYCTPHVIKENFENFLIHRCNYILLSQVYCVWQVVKTTTTILNNRVHQLWREGGTVNMNCCYYSWKLRTQTQTMLCLTMSQHTVEQSLCFSSIFSKYRWTAVTRDSVSTVSVIRGWSRPEKKKKGILKK